MAGYVMTFNSELLAGLLGEAWEAHLQHILDLTDEAWVIWHVDRRAVCAVADADSLAPTLSFQTCSVTRELRRSPTCEIMRRTPMRRHADGWSHLEKTSVVRRAKDLRQDSQRW